MNCGCQIPTPDHVNHAAEEVVLLGFFDFVGFSVEKQLLKHIRFAKTSISRPDGIKLH